MSTGPIANNKKAYHDYEILEKLEVGIELVGSEVKSIRAGRVNLKESYIRFVKGKVPTVFQMHIARLPNVNPTLAPEETRPRRLLMHKTEIRKWQARVKLESLTVVPLKIYFNRKNLCKMEIGLAKGKKLHDKRHDIKQRDVKREMDRAAKRYTG